MAFVIFLMFWLLVLTIITVRGNLPYSTKITKKLEEGKSSDDASPTAGTSTNVPRPGSSSSPRGSTSNSPLDETRWYTTELFKVCNESEEISAHSFVFVVRSLSTLSKLLQSLQDSTWSGQAPYPAFLKQQVTWSDFPFTIL